MPTTINKVHPLPWRIEYDWTAEIVDARGRTVLKLPNDDPRAPAIVEAANAFWVECVGANG